MQPSSIFFFFFFNDTATTEIYTLSLHDALPIYSSNPIYRKYYEAYMDRVLEIWRLWDDIAHEKNPQSVYVGDRKSTRLNSSHGYISYAVFCLKKKKKT